MPSASITIYAEPAVLAVDDELVELLEKHEVEFGDRSDPEQTIMVSDPDSSLGVEDGRVHVWFFENSLGAALLPDGALQQALRARNIAYHLRSEVYVGDADYSYVNHYWQPGWESELTREENDADGVTLSGGEFRQMTEGMSDEQVGAAVREFFNFRFDPPVRTL